MQERVDPKKEVPIEITLLRNRYNIGKHASEFGTASTLRRFKGEFPQLKESTVRSIHSKYEEELRVALKQKREPNTTLPIGATWKTITVGKD